jgi:hypothetical protein
MQEGGAKIICTAVLQFPAAITDAVASAWIAGIYSAN